MSFYAQCCVNTSGASAEPSFCKITEPMPKCVAHYASKILRAGDQAAAVFCGCLQGPKLRILHDFLMTQR